MGARTLALVTFVATVLLIMLGGLVHATGSSLACPDWPLCFGQLMPPMQGGVLYEHSHRLLASGVGILTILLALALYRERGRDRGLGRAGLFGVIVVVVQGVLGGITVLAQLPPVVSTAHLALSMFFLSWVVYVYVRLRYPVTTDAAQPGVRSLVGLSLLALYVQIVLGALVRHSGAGLACGVTVLTCDGALVPTGGPAWVNWGHRLLALGVAGLIIATAYRVRKLRYDRTFPLVSKLAMGGVHIVLSQVVIGALTVFSGLAIPLSVAHVGLAALALSDLVALYLVLGRHSAVGA